MSLRRKFALALAAFAVGLAALFGYLAWRIASDALEAELDRRLTWVAGAVNAVGAIQGDPAILLEPGFEDESVWTAYHARLADLRDRYVSEAFVFDGRDPEFRALVTAAPADSVPIGTPLRRLEGYRDEVDEALRGGSSTTPAFEGDDGRLYKYGFVQLDQSTAVMGVLIPADWYQPLAGLRNTLLWASGAALLVAVFLAGWLARNVARPLEGMARAALRIQRGHMERPVEIDREDELGRLSRAMERMRKGILERDEQLRLMLAQVAHEIRNPLGGLELFASAAAESEDPDERRRLMERIREEVVALNRIIDDFLAFARPLGRERSTTDLREPVRAASELAAGDLERRGGRLELELPDERLPAVVDEDQVKRAVLNLLRNAAQVAERVRLRAERSGSGLVVTVTDDGPGVPEERRDRIFEPFVTDKEKGAGLGLAIVRKVVEAHGGRVEVDEAREDGFGNGAEFRLYFVGLEEPPAGPREPSPEEAETSPATT